MNVCFVRIESNGRRNIPATIRAAEAGGKTQPHAGFQAVAAAVAVCGGDGKAESRIEVVGKTVAEAEFGGMAAGIVGSVVVAVADGIAILAFFGTAAVKQAFHSITPCGKQGEGIGVEGGDTAVRVADIHRTAAPDKPDYGTPIAVIAVRRSCHNTAVATDDLSYCITRIVGFQCAKVLFLQQAVVVPVATFPDGGAGIAIVVLCITSGRMPVCTETC